MTRRIRRSAYAILTSFLTVLLLFFFGLLLYRSVPLQEAARDALLFSAKTLIPSLFPFAVLSRFLLLSELLPKGGAPSRKIASWFGVSVISLPSLAVGLFCGFPMGAFAAATLLEKRKISQDEAFYIASVANNASAPFLLLTASALFGNSLCGKILFASQSAASLVVGVVRGRSRRKKEGASCPIDTAPRLDREKKPPLMPLAADAVVKGGTAMLSVTAFVVFFSVVAKAISLIPLLSSVSSLLLTLLEATSAVRHAAALVPQYGLSLCVALAAFASGWSGLSVLLQSEALFDGKLPLAPLAATRAAIAILSALFAFLLCRIFAL